MANAIKIVGLKETVKQLEALGIQAQDFKPIWQQVMGPIHAESVAAMPVRTGRLARSVKIFKRKNAAGIYIRKSKALRYDRFAYFGGGKGHRGKPYNRVFTKMIDKHEDDIRANIDRRIEELKRRNGLA